MNDASSPKAQLILHRLSFDDRKSQFFSAHGVLVTKTRTLEHLEEALRHPGPSVVVLDLSSGGQAPEQAWALLQPGMNAGHPPAVIGCTPHRGSSPVRRAEKLGLKTILLWPEGVFSELIRRFDMEPQMALSRSAERTSVRRSLGKLPGYLVGQILNVSRSGAMVETQEALELGAQVHLLLSLDKQSVEHSIQVKVCWVEKSGKVFRTGLQFVAGLSEEDGQKIDEYVKKRNVIDVEQASQLAAKRPHKHRGQKVKVKAVDSKRVDYMFLDRFRLIPPRNVAVPYVRGQRLEVRFLTGTARAMLVEVTGHEPPPPLELNAPIRLKVRELKKRTPLPGPAAHQHQRQRDNQH